jgi:hypothetical protein
MATKQQIAMRDEARAHLREYLKPGDTIYCTLRHVSRSGMQREISFHVIRDDEPRWLDYWIARACDYRRGKREGLIVSGCGMDMGFHVVYHLGAVLWPNGTPAPHGTRNGEPDSAGGYALKSRWI